MSEPNSTFISHASENAEFAHRLASDLKERGVNTWIAPDNIPPGDKWRDAVQEAAAACGVMLVIISRDSMASDNVRDEYGITKDRKIPIIPIKLSWEEGDKIILGLNEYQMIDMSSAPTYLFALETLVGRLTQLGFVKVVSFETLLDNYPSEDLFPVDLGNPISSEKSQTTLSDSDDHSPPTIKGGSPGLYGGLIFSDNYPDLLYGVNAIIATGKNLVEEWYQWKLQYEHQQILIEQGEMVEEPVDPPQRPRFVDILIGLIFDEHDDVAMSAIQALDSLKLPAQMPDLIYLIGLSAVVRDRLPLLDEILSIISVYASENNRRELIRLRHLLIDKYAYDYVERIDGILEYLDQQMRVLIPDHS